MLVDEPQVILEILVVLAAPPITLVQVVPLKTCNSPAVPQFVHQTISPAAAETMAFLWVCVILGGSIPLVELVTSNSAEASGVVVPIPTWEKMVLLKATVNALRIMIRLNFMYNRFCFNN